MWACRESESQSLCSNVGSRSNQCLIFKGVKYNRKAAFILSDPLITSGGKAPTKPDIQQAKRSIADLLQNTGALCWWLGILHLKNPLNPLTHTQNVHPR